ncbi:hypothetical protein [Citrobacter freundii]|uniref:hypothetical protein n=1 Tax=Citrobacter freundii TaxID=546 RepID=UPI000F4F4AD0|nr:hypothetical protein [Citrobacter freundii]AYY47777.1 hypothetical protein EGX89_03950 [Citrobacter freundii]
MDSIELLLSQIDRLCAISDEVVEESYRLTISGSKVDQAIAELCLEIGQSSSDLTLPCPTFKVGNENVDAEEVTEFVCSEDSKWCVVISKNPLAQRLALNKGDVSDFNHILFLSELRAIKWVKARDPFITENGDIEPDFVDKTIIWIYNLTTACGGNHIIVLPANQTIENTNATNKNFALPEASEVADLVKINSDNHLRIRPDAFIITWGERNSEIAVAFILLAVKNLLASISNELKSVGVDYFVSFKGTKVLTKSLCENVDVDLSILQDNLIKTVSWVYAERKETRLQLVMDRLSLDIIPANSFYKEVSENINIALQQSQDSYAFVILDRKDAYHKEMRELLKDMRSQADMYASKVRDLVSNITRDILGILAFVGYSFLGKFDKKNISELLDSHELNLLVKFLAGYLFLSCVLQVVVHLRDAFLTSKESENWLKVLQRYTSREENKESFLQPIKKRRGTLYISLSIMAVIYLILALCTWNLPSIVSFLLA